MSSFEPNVQSGGMIATQWAGKRVYEDAFQLNPARQRKPAGSIIATQWAGKRVYEDAFQLNPARQRPQCPGRHAPAAGLEPPRSAGPLPAAAGES